jgi:anti-sigma regulatory factor (Ser/Thr protein kinase)
MPTDAQRLSQRSFAADIGLIEDVTAFVEGSFRKADVPEKTVIQMNIAVDEIFSNIARYSGAASADVACGVAGGEAVLRFTDDGELYDPTQRKDPDVTLSAEEREIGGLGIFMVKKFMDSMLYERRDGKNVLTLVKKLN